MSEHSLLSASSSDRWTKCPISVTATSEDRTNEAAAEGTALHGVAERVLRGNGWPEIGSTLEADGFEFVFNEERYFDTKAYTDYVMSLPWVGTYNVEARIHYGQYLNTPHNLSFGTSDCFGFVEDAEGRRLVIIDLKMGRKPVNPAYNPQAALYGAGVLQSLRPMMLPRNFPVEIMIVQPRLRHAPFRWVTSVGWLEDTAMAMRPPAAAALAYKTGTATAQTWAEFPELAGSWCRYCRRKAECTEFNKHMAAIAQPGKKVEWNPVVFAMRDAISSYLEDLEQLAFDEAMNGNVLSGTKLIKGRAGKPALAKTDEEIREAAKKLGIEKSVVKMEEVWATPAKIRDAFKRAGMADADVCLQRLHDLVR